MSHGFVIVLLSHLWVEGKHGKIEIATVGGAIKLTHLEARLVTSEHVHCEAGRKESYKFENILEIVKDDSLKCNVFNLEWYIIEI